MADYCSCSAFTSQRWPLDYSMDKKIEPGTWVVEAEPGAKGFQYPCDDGMHRLTGGMLCEVLSWPKIRGLQAVKLENEEVVWVEPGEILDAE